MDGATPPARRQKILIVDDDEEFAEITRITLEQAGYEASIAAGGIESLEKVRTEGRPDLVLLDYMMPGMDGLMTLKVLENFILAARVPVIFCSAVSERRIITQALMKGARDYLVKPFTPADLLDTIATHLRALSA